MAVDDGPLIVPLTDPIFFAEGWVERSAPQRQCGFVGVRWYQLNRRQAKRFESFVNQPSRAFDASDWNIAGSIVTE